MTSAAKLMRETLKKFAGLLVNISTHSPLPQSWVHSILRRTRNYQDVKSMFLQYAMPAQRTPKSSGS